MGVGAVSIFDVGPVRVQFLASYVPPSFHGQSLSFECLSRHKLYPFAFSRGLRRIELSLHYGEDGNTEVLRGGTRRLASGVRGAVTLGIALEQYDDSVFFASLLIDKLNRVNAGVRNDP